MVKKVGLIVGGALLLLVLALAIGLAWLRAGNLPDRGRSIEDREVLDLLDAEVRVKRDRHGVPYIYAETLADAMRAQGFVTAQDRLSQMLLTRELINGRLSAQIGPAGLRSDRLIRVMGLPRMGRVWAAQLESPSRELHEWYLQGVNAYIATQQHEFPLAVRLAPEPPQPFTLEDLTTQYLFLAYSSTGNWRAELLSQALVDHLGAERAAEISMLTVNPDDESEWASDYALAENSELPGAPEGVPAGRLEGTQAGSPQGARTGRPVGEPQGAQAGRAAGGPQGARTGRPVGAPAAFAVVPGPAGGSNSWATSGPRSARGAPILANDPHIDVRRLPGIWYPVALITPEWRAVGAAGAGLPGLGLGRSDRIAFGVTNAYSDVADLFIETPDPERPDHYLEGEQSLPFRTVTETIRIRDRSVPGGYREEPLTIRHTRRGPVISDHGLTNGDGRIYTLRWSVAENIGTQIGIERVMLAQDVAEAAAVIRQINAPYNYTVADIEGNIAHYTAGHVPVRRRGDGALPVPVAGGEEEWRGFVPFEQAPAALNPDRGWVGNANHRFVRGDFTGHWTSYAAASWRYRRMQELFAGERPLSDADHWAAIIDTLNPMARDLVPLMVQALETDPQTQAAAAILRDWNFFDEPELAAPALFQALMGRLVQRIFEDELGEALARQYASDIYYWQERVRRMLLAREWAWFDDGRTEAVEGRDDLIRAAAQDAWAELQSRLGPEPSAWRWGDLSRLRFRNPWVPGAIADRLLGGGDYPGRGSGETLGRARFPGLGNYDPRVIDSARFVADLGDPHKVLGVVPGGVSARLFDPHLNDQLPTWLAGDAVFWWFSDEAITAHTQQEMTFTP